MDEILYLIALVVGSVVAFYLYRYQKEKREKAKEKFKPENER
ncbi:hypothetical protein [Brevibacillus choshinensis]|nr:hypothetical protein [Brevibacillus choshinensis]